MVFQSPIAALARKIVVLVATTSFIVLMPVGIARADLRCPNNDPWYEHCVGGAILQEFNEAGGYGSFGNAVNAESNAANGGRWQAFQNDSSIYWHPLVSGGHANSIRGAIRQKWYDNGYESGALQYPTTRELAARKPGRFNNFEGGTIYWSAGTGAHVVWGAIRTKWESVDRENGILGFPKGEEYVTKDNGRGQQFEGGWIYWHPSTGAMVVRNATGGYWSRANWENGVYGYPTEDTRLVGCTQQAQRFQGGIIVTGIENYVLPYNSVDGNEIAYSASFTDQRSITAWNASVAAWNTLNRINVHPSGVFGYDLTVNEVNLPDESYSARYTNYGPLPDQIRLNRAFTDQYSDVQRKVVLMHELGHAHGLDHSCNSQVMGPDDDRTATDLQELDKAVYRYIWGW